MINSVARLALRDISEYVNNNNIFKRPTFYSIGDAPSKIKRSEIWSVNQEYLFTKEQRRLNKELGLHKINKEHNAINLIRK